jgi:hypothetical protein
MKKLFTLAAIVTAAQFNSLIAQPSPAIAPEGTASGQITLTDNSTVSGAIKENIRKKGEVILVQDGKKTKFKAGDISQVSLNGATYVTQHYTFYEVVWTGKKLTLLRKASEPGIQYNGSEAIVISSPGSIDDLFIKQTGSTSLQPVDKKNYKTVLQSICSTCTIADETKVDQSAIKKAVESCDACQ